MARPSLYKKKYCDELLAHMSEGFSFENFAGLIGVHRDTLYEWTKAHPEFSDAKKRGLDLSLLFWERLGIRAASGELKGINPAIFIFTLKNRFGWKDQPVEKEEQVRTFTLAYRPGPPSQCHNCRSEKEVHSA